MSVVNHVFYTDLYNELCNYSRPNFRNFSLENHLLSNIAYTQDKAHETLNNVRVLEYNIRRHEPEFRSPISVNYYPLVSRR